MPVDVRHPLVSIIFPNWNGKEDTLECLESIRCLDYPLDQLEVIVVDNASQDGSQQAIVDKLELLEVKGLGRGKLIELSENIGPAGASNVGFGQSDPQADYVLRLDNDVVLEQDYVSKLLEVMCVVSEIGAASGRVVYYDSPHETAHGAGYMNWWLGRPSNKDRQGTTDCDFVTGCGCLVRKSAVEELGQFMDEDYFLYYNDVDLCLCLQEIGYRITYVPTACIAHKVSSSTGGRKKSAFALYYDLRNRFILMDKHAGPIQRHVFGVYAYLMVVMRLLRVRARSQAKAVLQAAADYRNHRWGYQPLR